MGIICFRQYQMVAPLPFRMMVQQQYKQEHMIVQEITQILLQLVSQKQQ